MAIAADTRPDAGLQRSPGDFWRNSQKTPYVANKDGELVKSGPRKGLPKLDVYGRPSGFGKHIEDDYALTKRSERFGVLGIGIDFAEACAALAVPALAAECAELVGMDPDSKEFRTAADRIIAEAKRIAHADLSAERGTHAHALTEDSDNGRDYTWRFPAGHELGLGEVVQHSLVAAWRLMLDANGLEVLATEMLVVHDEFRLAGTLDRIVRLTRDLHFVHANGEVITLAAGTVVVLDIKSGKLRLEYWTNYSVQIAAYAGGCAYDPETDTRTPFAWPVDQRWALIAHLDVLGAMDGNPSCSLVLVDIESGREVGARLVLEAKAWGKRSDLFSISQITISQIADASPHASDEQATTVAVPTSAAAAVAAEPSPAELHARLRRHPDIDEGTVADTATLDVAFTKLAEHYLAMEPTAKSWVNAIQDGAKRNGCGFHAKEAHTLRRFELIRGLTTLAGGGLDDDELVRILVHHVTGDDAALFPIIHPGHALGALDAGEAHRFAKLAIDVATGHLALRFDDLGRPQLTPAAA